MIRLRKIIKICEYPECKKNSIVELLSNDFLLGKYCEKHGNIKLKERKQFEEY